MFYIIILIILIVCSYIYYKFADRFNIIDKPNHRSSHTQITIRGGGILFFIALLLFFITNDFQYPLLFIGATLIGGLSFIDDLRPLSPSLRLPFQFIAIILILVEVKTDFSIYVNLCFLIVGVGFVNAFNFMDGINAITGFYAIVIIAGLLFFNSTDISFVNNEILIFLLMSLFVFGYYNFRKKALFFAGDVGSITLAVIIFFLILRFFVHTHSPLTLLFLSVYGVDSVLTIIRRILLKEKISEAHRHHLYQILVDSKKLTHLQTALIYAIVQILLILVVFYFINTSLITQSIVTFISIIFLSITYLIIIKRVRDLKFHLK